MHREARRFFLKGLGLIALFYGLTLFGSVLFDQIVDWRAYQDPRKRLLWDRIDLTSEIIILGDSVFQSQYVDTEEQTLWAVLERLTGKRVFNGTLDGADAPDFVKAGRFLAQHEGGGRIVLLDIIPTRFLRNRAPMGQSGNYATEFSRRLGENPLSRLLVYLGRPLLVLDSDILINCLKRKQFFGAKRYRDVVWSDDGGHARWSFQGFERYWVDDRDLESFGWIEELEVLLKTNGYRLVLVLTPMNGDLLKKYARLVEPGAVERRLEFAHEALVRYLREKQIAYIDIYGHLPSEDFIDLFHVNASGERRIAELIAIHLRADTRPRSGL
jgi:hypothetical protein